MNLKKIILTALAVGLIVIFVLCLSSCVQDPQAATCNDRLNTFVITDIDQRQGQKNTVLYTAKMSDSFSGTHEISFNDSVGKFIIGDAVRFYLIRQ